MPDILRTIPMNSIFTYMFNSINILQIEVQPTPEQGTITLIGSELTFTPTTNYVSPPNPQDAVPFSVGEYIDIGGGATQNVATYRFYITVTGPPTITQPLTNQIVYVGQSGKIMTVIATDVSSYTWYVDDVLRQGPNGSNILSVSSTQYTAGAHTVRVVVTNTVGSTESTASLTVVPQIRPITYVDTGTVSSGCLVSVGGRGDTGRWSAPPTIQLLDPSGTNTVASVTAAYNSLITALGEMRLIHATLLQFGPISNGVGRGLGATISLNEIDGGSYYELNMYGYIVPVGSPWIGRKFNRILFPKLGSPPQGLATKITSTDAPLYVTIYPTYPYGGQNVPPINTITVITITGTAGEYNTAYTIAITPTITLTADMYIEFSSDVNGVKLITFNNNANIVPLNAFYTYSYDNLVNPPSFITSVVQGSAIVCDFDLI